MTWKVSTSIEVFLSEHERIMVQSLGTKRNSADPAVLLRDKGNVIERW